MYTIKLTASELWQVVTALQLKEDHVLSMAAAIEESAPVHDPVGSFGNHRIEQLQKLADTYAELAARLLNIPTDEANASLLEVIEHALEQTTKSPILMDYNTGAEIRPATAEELIASERAANNDSGAGVIEVDGRKCYVR